MFSRFIGLVGGETKLHFTLIDPEEQSPEVAVRRARLCASYGSDAVMIGGSTIKGKDKGLVHDTIKAIKDSVDI
ncbi:MAG: geranylgeranylglyceryl/heptaprenylglyceryl phosphate synthase, partial [Candidatus Altiarchaeota archaeon]|nr:geranylgeranylglyceryl/heptaprenylglyceryl phosphate synthase [Candidatus Altiarchaeota archaeon]